MAKNYNKERDEFLEVYNQFDNWLKLKGFKKENPREHSNVSFPICDEPFQPLAESGFEVYFNRVYGKSIYFFKNNSEHQIMFVGSYGTYIKVMSLQEAKESILTELCKMRDGLLSEIESIDYTL